MSDILGLINLQCPNTMKELSAKRPLASEPFGAKFRLMDFALSNMVNAGIDTVGLILPFHSRSVLDHVRSAKEWDLAQIRQRSPMIALSTTASFSTTVPGRITELVTFAPSSITTL